MERAIRADDRVILENKSKFLKAHSSSGHKRAIEEILEDETFSKLLADVKAAGETKALQHFHTTLLGDEDRACYGYDFVKSADEQMAVEHMLVTDKFFKVTLMLTRTLTLTGT